MQKPQFLFVLFFYVFSIVGFSQSSTNKVKDTVSYVLNLHQKAIKDMRIEQLDSVPEYLIEAKRVLTGSNMPRYEALNANTLAYFYMELENYDAAISESHRALHLLDSLPPTLEEGYAYHLLGVIYTRSNDFDKAKEYLDKTEETFRAIHADTELKRLTLNRGVLEYEKENYEKALDIFEAVIDDFVQMNMSYYACITYYMISKTKLQLIKIGAYDDKKYLPEVKSAITKGLAIAEEGNYVDAKLDIYKVYTGSLLYENDPQKAIDTYIYFSDARDSIMRHRVKVLNRYLNLENKEEDLRNIIASQQKFLDQKEKSTWMNRITTWLSLFLIVMLSLLTLALYKNNSLRAKTYKLLKEKNEELVLAKERAERASNAKSQFLSAVTHELRTPMYAITGLTQLLLDESPNNEQKEHLSSLKFSGEYLLSLINNILDLNKLEANKVEIDKKLFELKKTMDDVNNSFRKALRDKNNKLVFEYDDAIPEKIIGDSIVVSQILINLIGNAIKFTENGTITVKARLLKRKKKRVSVYFEVEDTGIGIPLKKQETIFDSFIQGSLQINRKYGGTGLGLPIVKNLMTLLDTKIELESEVDKGTKFYFAIKFGLPKTHKKKTVQEISSLPIEKEATQIERPQLHVLLVEDNKINQLVTKKFLDKKNIQSTIVDNGLDAITAVENGSFDLILMDIHMPKMSGIEATENIRKFNKDIPIFALTALSVENNMSEFFDAGFNDVIPKPFKPEVFFEKIENIS